MLMLVAAHAAHARSARPGPGAAVAVRTYNYAAVSTDQLAAARSERRASSTALASRSVDRVSRARRARRRSVHGTAGRGTRSDAAADGRAIPAQGDRIVALGESMLDREQRGGVLMTIDVFPVRAVAERASRPCRRCSAARSRTKSATCCSAAPSILAIGLMRALWSHEELRGLKPAHWGFSAREAAQMRQAVRKSPKSQGR